MVGELIMLPLRVGVRASKLWLRATEETVAVAAGATSRVIEVVTSRSSNRTATRPSEAVRERRATEGDGDTDAVAPQQPIRRPSPVTPRPHAEAKPAPSVEPMPPPAPEPAHVSEEPTLVEEFAEPGAEDGAGAEVHIEPPWDGYDEMTAKQVISRFASASPAELAAVQLYESGRRRRQTILNALQRELRGRNGSGSPSQ